MRGRPHTTRCPSCKAKNRATIDPTHRRRRSVAMRRGRVVTRQTRVTCDACGHAWWSTIP